MMILKLVLNESVLWCRSMNKNNVDYFDVFLCSVGCHGDYCCNSLNYLCNSHLHRLLLSPQVSVFNSLYVS